MATNYDQIRPLKGIIQSNGEVILGEFTDFDFISVETGGTGSITGSGARSNLQLIKYNEYVDFSSFETPTTSQLALNYDDGKMYYSHNNEWISISDTLAKHSSDVGFNNVESFIFDERFITLYNDGILEVDIDLDDIIVRLDIIEGDVSVGGSILNIVQSNMDLLLDGVIPELDTLKEIATSLGDAVDIKSQLDVNVSNLSSEILNRIDADNLLTTNILTVSNRVDVVEGDVSVAGSILNIVQSNVDLLLDGVVPELNTLQKIATSLWNSSSISDELNLLSNTISTETLNRIFNDNQINTTLDNFSYSGHDSSNLNDARPIGLQLNKVTGKYNPSKMNSGHYISFIKHNYIVNNIPLISTFDGDELLSSSLRFWYTNGNQDNISFIIQ